LKTEEKALPVMDIAPEIGIEMESLYPHLLLSSCPLVLLRRILRTMTAPAGMRRSANALKEPDAANEGVP
jgi:hypothetical protein